MTMALRRSRIFSSLRILGQVRHMSMKGGWGEGAGKGGGTGGAVRDAGGSFGKREAAQEEQYFRKLQAEQLAKLKEHHKTEIKATLEQIQDLENEIARHKESLEELRQMEKGKPE